MLSQLLTIYSEQYYVMFLSQFCIHILNYYTPFSQILSVTVLHFTNLYKLFMAFCRA